MPSRHIGEVRSNARRKSGPCRPPFILNLDRLSLGIRATSSSPASDTLCLGHPLEQTRSYPRRRNGGGGTTRPAGEGRLTKSTLATRIKMERSGVTRGRRGKKPTRFLNLRTRAGPISAVVDTGSYSAWVDSELYQQISGVDDLFEI